MEGVNIKIDYYPPNNNIVIIKLSGYIDQSNSHELEALIHDLLHSNKKHFVFDLDQLVYMSSAGWGIFVGEIKNVRDAGGDIKVAAMSPEVYDVFQVLEFYHIFEDYATTEEAIYSFIHTDFGGVIELEEEAAAAEESVEENDGQTASEGNSEPALGKIYELPKSDSVESGKVDNTVEKPAVNTTEVRKSAGVSHPKPKIKTQDKEHEIDISTLPVAEKARRIITVYPLLNIWQIRKMLRHEKFGNTKIGIIKLYKILREINLHTKKLRYRYYRSV